MRFWLGMYIQGVFCVQALPVSWNGIRQVVFLRKNQTFLRMVQHILFEGARFFNCRMQDNFAALSNMLLTLNWTYALVPHSPHVCDGCVVFRTRSCDNTTGLVPTPHQRRFFPKGNRTTDGKAWFLDLFWLPSSPLWGDLRSQPSEWRCLSFGPGPGFSLQACDIFGELVPSVCRFFTLERER